MLHLITCAFSDLCDVVEIGAYCKPKSVKTGSHGAVAYYPYSHSYSYSQSSKHKAFTFPHHPNPQEYEIPLAFQLQVNIMPENSISEKVR